MRVADALGLDVTLSPAEPKTPATGEVTTVVDVVRERLYREKGIIEVHATVSVILNEFELVHAETDDGQLTLCIGDGTAGVDWRCLAVGQRLQCVVRTGAGTLVLNAKVLP